MCIRDRGHAVRQALIPHNDIHSERSFPMKRSTLALAAALCLLPLSAIAHKQWMVPSATVVAGNDAWVTVDAAVSNQLYYPCLLYTSRCV